MPNWLKWLLVMAALLLIGSNVYLYLRIQRIHGYLGSNRGAPDTWTGLTGNIRRNNEDLRSVLTQMSCDIWLLQHPGQPTPTPCPPPGPGTVPAPPPDYPP